MAGAALEKGSVVRVRGVNDSVEEQGPPSSWVGRGEVQDGFFEFAIAWVHPVPLRHMLLSVCGHAGTFLPSFGTPIADLIVLFEFKTLNRTFNRVFAARVQWEAAQRAINPAMAAGGSIRANGHEQPVTQIDSEVTVRLSMHARTFRSRKQVRPRTRPTITVDINSILIPQRSNEIPLLGSSHLLGQQALHFGHRLLQRTKPVHVRANKSIPGF